MSDTENMITRSGFAAALLMVPVMACSQSSASVEEQVLATLHAIGDRCSDQHGYDWRSPGELGEFELGAGEKPWRQCVYAGIRREIVPESRVPRSYERIIAQDEEFTAAIEAGHMTRTQRWRRNDAETESLLISESLAAKADQEEKVDAMVGEMQRDQMQRIREQALRNVLRGVSPTPRPY